MKARAFDAIDLAKERRDRCTCWFSGVPNSGQLHGLLLSICVLMKRCVAVLVCMCPPASKKLHVRDTESQHSAVLLPQRGNTNTPTQRYQLYTQAQIHKHTCLKPLLLKSQSLRFSSQCSYKRSNSNETYPYSHTQNHAQTLATVMVIFSVSSTPPRGSDPLWSQSKPHVWSSVQRQPTCTA